MSRPRPRILKFPRKSDLRLVRRLSPKQIRELLGLYRREWWSKTRKEAEVRQMLKNTDLIFGLCDARNEKLVAFTRVLTDFTYKALIFDVIVDESYRNLGLGKRLIDEVLKHPRVRKVKHVELYCLPELVSFYRKWGFTEKLGRLTFMRLKK
jgi:ribosomal protein S18 acetylase RimI-like enzyme